MKPLFLILLIFVGPIFGQTPTAANLAREGRHAEAAALYAAQGTIKGYLNASMCLKMSGDLGQATAQLNLARKLAQGSTDTRLLLQLEAQAGSIFALGKKPTRAIDHLRRAHTLAGKIGATDQQAGICNDLGIALSSSGDYRGALDWFHLASQSQDESLRKRAMHNHLIASFQAWQKINTHISRIREVDGFIPPELKQELQTAGTKYEDSLNRSLLILDGAKVNTLNIYHTHSAGLSALRYGLTEKGFTSITASLKSARKLKYRDLERGCLLSLAEFYLDQNLFKDTHHLLEEARAIEEKTNDIQRAQLEQLTARYHKAKGASAATTKAAIDRAVQAVENIRSDLARTQNISDLGRSFRERAGRPYLLLADHHLAQNEFTQAREAIEAFKAWELEDFYRDDCVNLTLQNTRQLDQLNDPGVGILYIIPLADRTEILLGKAGKTHRWKSSLSATELQKLARRFRYQLEADYGTPSYLETAHELYQELISGGTVHLKSLKHLVFVPDGSLGNIPLAALSNPKTDRFLVEDFSLSIAPSLSLTPGPEKKSITRAALLAGSSEFAGEFSDLPGTKKEVAFLKTLYREPTVIFNETFSSAALAKTLRDSPISVAHVATHGEFKGAANETFLLAHGNEKISLDQLEEMIRPKKYRGQPLELLCLSACRTAAGDDRAALGFAGSAVKSGSRSVVASLWYIDDAASSKIIPSFHQHFLSGLSKAEALRKAQLDFLRNNSQSHPHFWAPFVLIGDWN